MRRRFDPIQHPMSNAILGENQPGVIPLPVTRMNIMYETPGIPAQEIPLVISCWKPSPEELAELVSGKGLVVLAIVGSTMPPVSIGVVPDDTREALVDLMTKEEGS